jgi:hypothetical protein
VRESDNAPSSSPPSKDDIAVTNEEETSSEIISREVSPQIRPISIAGPRKT